MTTLMLKILLHHYTSPGHFHPGGALSKSETEAYVELQQLDLLTDRAAVTPRGAAHVQTLLDAPLPEMQWVKPTWTTPSMPAKGKK